MGNGTKLAGGLVLLHVVCCGLPLLIAAGALGGAGALWGSPVLLGVGTLGVIAALAVAPRRMRAGAQCCDQDDLGENAEEQVRPPAAKAS